MTSASSVAHDAIHSSSVPSWGRGDARIREASHHECVFTLTGTDIDKGAVKDVGCATEKRILNEIWPNGAYSNKEQMTLSREPSPISFRCLWCGRVIRLALCKPKPETVYIPQIRVETSDKDRILSVYKSLVKILSPVSMPPIVTKMSCPELCKAEDKYFVAPINMLQAVGYERRSGVYVIALPTQATAQYAKDMRRALEAEIAILRETGGSVEAAPAFLPWEDGAVASRIASYTDNVSVYMTDLASGFSACKMEETRDYFAEASRVWTWTASYWYFEFYSIIRSEHRGLATQLLEAATRLVCAIAQRMWREGHPLGEGEGYDTVEHRTTGSLVRTCPAPSEMMREPSLYPTELSGVVTARPGNQLRCEQKVRARSPTGVRGSDVSRELFPSSLRPGPAAHDGANLETAADELALALRPGFPPGKCWGAGAAMPVFLHTEPHWLTAALPALFCLPPLRRWFGSFSQQPEHPPPPAPSLCLLFTRLSDLFYFVQFTPHRHLYATYAIDAWNAHLHATTEGSRMESALFSSVFAPPPTAASDARKADERRKRDNLHAFLTELQPVAGLGDVFRFAFTADASCPADGPPEPDDDSLSSLDSALSNHKDSGSPASPKQRGFKFDALERPGGGPSPAGARRHAQIGLLLKPADFGAFCAPGGGALSLAKVLARSLQDECLVKCADGPLPAVVWVESCGVGRLLKACGLAVPERLDFAVLRRGGAAHRARAEAQRLERQRLVLETGACGLHAAGAAAALFGGDGAPPPSEAEAGGGALAVLRALPDVADRLDDLGRVLPLLAAVLPAAFAAPGAGYAAAFGAAAAGVRELQAARLARKAAVVEELDAKWDEVTAAFESSTPTHALTSVIYGDPPTFLDMRQDDAS
eukprot:gene12174-18813_t